MKAEKREILEKIAKILNLAKDQEGTPEGELAMERATALMAKYSISEAELSVKKDSIAIKEVAGLKDKGGWRQWIVDLAASLSYTFDCHIFFYKRSFKITFLGTKDDVETCAFLFYKVLQHVEVAAWETWPNERYWRKRNEVGNAAMGVIWTRLSNIKSRMETVTRGMGSNCTALVGQKKEMVSRKVDEYYRNHGINLKRGRSRSRKVVSEKSLLAGKRAGETAPLNSELNKQTAAIGG